MKILLKSLLVAAAMSVGASAAHAVPILIDFSSGTLSGTPTIYTEDSFVFSSSTNNVAGNVNTSTCPPTGKCLQFSNNEKVTMTYLFGAFDLDGFIFRGPSNDLAFELVASNGFTEQFGETLGGNDMMPRSYTTELDGIQWVSFRQLNTGSGFIDSIELDVTLTRAAIPVPAAGFLLVGAIGAFGLMRRRKTA